MANGLDYLQSVLKEFRRYKSLGDKTFGRLGDEDIHWKAHEDNNSIAVIAKHMAGNMLSRWTNFLTEDGEKEWRKRDSEFQDNFRNKEEMISYWEKGWSCLFETLGKLKPDDLEASVFIRGEKHSVTEAVNRQLGHHAYHTGQIVLLAKQILGDQWESLSIPKGRSAQFNKSMFKK